MVQWLVGLAYRLEDLGLRPTRGITLLPFAKISGMWDVALGAVREGIGIVKRGDTFSRREGTV